jgi:hypothetical protein
VAAELAGADLAPLGAVAALRRGAACLAGATAAVRAPAACRVAGAARCGAGFQGAVHQRLGSASSGHAAASLHHMCVPSVTDESAETQEDPVVEAASVANTMLVLEGVAAEGRNWFYGRD